MAKNTSNKTSKPFPESRVLTSSQLVHDMKELSEDNVRFCFILGSGASVESGIPSGQTMEWEWMKEIMSQEKDFEILAEKLYSEEEIDHPFSDLKAVWNDAVANKKTP